MQNLHEIIVEHCHTPITLVGHSWGAWLGYLFAVYYPAITEKLIIIGAGSFDAKYNVNIMDIRLGRLPEKAQREALILSALVNEGKASDSDFRRFGDLMSKADSYDCMDNTKELLKVLPGSLQFRLERGGKNEEKRRTFGIGP